MGNVCRRSLSGGIEGVWNLIRQKVFEKYKILTKWRPYEVYRQLKFLRED